jgi:hypothetical protein
MSAFPESGRSDTPKWVKSKVRIWTPPHLQAICCGRHGTTAYVYPASKVGIRLLMPGHNGLFARQSQSLSRTFMYVDIAGFP